MSTPRHPPPSSSSSFFVSITCLLAIVAYGYAAFWVFESASSMIALPWNNNNNHQQQQQQHPSSSSSSDIDIDIDDNAKIINVACVGDSITFHSCVTSDNMTYVAQIGSLLGPDKYNVTNFGVGAQTMLKDGICGCTKPEEKSKHCSYWDTKVMQDALNSSPDIVTIMMGTNDAKVCNWYGPPNGSPSGIEFRSAYLDMISKFHSLPSQPKVYVVIPPPLANPPDDPEKPPPFEMSKHVINNLYPGVLQKSIALEAGADGLIDVWTALGGEAGYSHEDMTCDGCHPKDKATTIIAKTIVDAIRAD